MAKGYINSTCVPVEDLDFEQMFGSCSFNDTLPVSDANAYIADAAPHEKESSISRFKESPDIVGLNFDSTAEASKYLGRMANYIEKNGKKYALSTAECSDGYDFRLSDVESFYNEVTTWRRGLTSEEQALLNVLIDKKILVFGPHDTSYHSSCNGALIAIVHDNSYSRSKIQTIFEHEYAHGRYFTDPQFRANVSDTWYGLSDEERAFLRSMMIASGYYASGYEWLMETEAHTHAIADPLGEDGFVNLLAGAFETCRNSESATCKTFWSFGGDTKSLFIRLHERFCAMPDGNISIADNKIKTKNTTIDKNTSKELKKIDWKSVIPLADKHLFPPVNVSDYIDRVQKEFDARCKR